MGLFCCNIHIKTDDRDEVEAALQGGPPSVVMEAAGGWVSVYVDGLLEQEEGPGQLAAELSSRLTANAVSFSVYDSDIARYWVHRSGELVDEYNSWPGYFSGEEPRPIGGSLDALVALSAPGYGIRELRRILAADVVFADDLITQLAQILGIPGDRATRDYRDTVSGDQDDSVSEALARATSHLQGKPLAEYDPGSIAMVAAAARGDLNEVTSLAYAGVSLEAPAPGPMPGSGAGAAGGLALQPEMTPLIAAVVNNQTAAAEALLDLGADPNTVHPTFGAAIHVAAGMASVDILDLLLTRGGNATIPGVQQQSPLEALAVSRQAFAMIGETRQMMESLDIDMASLDELGPLPPTDADWERCEALLRARGADS